MKSRTSRSATRRANGQQALASSRLLVSNAGFDQVTQAVEFMLDLQIDPALSQGNGVGCR